jgi:hypothetical protein
MPDANPCAIPDSRLRRRFLLAAGALLVAAHATGPARAAPADNAPVDLALVMAVDVSESVDAGEYELQHEGIARAFEDARLVDAVAAGPHHAIEVAVIEWSDRDKQIVTVDWTPVRDAASARAFAAAVRATRRSSNGLTAIGDALLAAKALLDRAPLPAERRMIDLSGDGMANIGPPVPAVRDGLVAEGIVINGLPILASEPWLASYYDTYVIGGNGAFLIEAEDFQSFANAMLNKLLTEVVRRTPADAPPRAVAGRGSPGLAQLAAASNPDR